MAALFGHRLVLPIGCSCITQFQLKGSARVAPSALPGYVFDWAIATPDSTVTILDRRAPFAEREGDLELVDDRVRSRTVPGFYFWHIKHHLQLADSVRIADLSQHPEGLRRFLEQHRHVMGKFANEVDQVDCVWSNIQPNLQHAVREVGESWSQFVLTPERYAAIKASCAQLPARKVTAWFVCRGDDVDRSLVGREDVVILDEPRSTTEFKGRPGLFDPVFERIGICGPGRV
jgi:hypothetical protein